MDQQKADLVACILFAIGQRALHLAHFLPRQQCNSRGRISCGADGIIPVALPRALMERFSPLVGLPLQIPGTGMARVVKPGLVVVGDGAVFEQGQQLFANSAAFLPIFICFIFI